MAKLYRDLEVKLVGLSSYRYRWVLAEELTRCEVARRSASFLNSGSVAASADAPILSTITHRAIEVLTTGAWRVLLQIVNGGM